METVYYRSACFLSMLSEKFLLELRCPQWVFRLQPKTKSEPHALMHGDEVKMGETVLSFHIHSGTDTCDGCEPGQVMAHISKHRREESTGERTNPQGEKKKGESL